MKRFSRISLLLTICILFVIINPQIGHSQQSVRIVGGELVEDLTSPEFKHTVRLLVQAYVGTEGVPDSIQGRKISWRCSGAILSDSAIISAAHCFPKTKVVPNPDNNEYIRVPLVNMKTSIYYAVTSGTGPISGAEGIKIIVHPDYDEKWVENVSNVWNPIERINDIAIVFLRYNIPYNKSMVRLLPPDYSIYRDDELILTGYGRSESQNPFEKPYLRKVKIPYNDKIRNETEFHAGIGNFSSPGEISNPAGGCAGDSGGPAFTNVKGEYNLTGLIVRGPGSNNGGCMAGVTILTDVRTYYDWILQTLSNH